MQQRVNKNTIQKEENQLSQMMAGYISYWPLFLICLILSLAGAYLYILYAVPKYEATASILVNDKGKGVVKSNTVQEIDPVNTSKTIENEVEVLQSQTLLDSVTVKLNLYAPISQEGKFKMHSAYNTCPVMVQAKFPNKLRKTEKIPFSFDSASATVLLNPRIKSPLNEWVKTPYGELMFLPNPNYTGYTGNNNYFLNLFKASGFSSNLLSSLKVESSKTSSVIELTFKDEVPDRAENILNTLVDFYDKSAVAEKNNLVKSTLTSIENRLVVVKAAIDSIQKKVKDYRTTHRVTDINEQGKNWLGAVGASDQEYTKVTTQLGQLQDLRNKVSSSENIGILPSATGITDPGLTTQMTTLTNMQLEYERLKKTVGENNPVISQLRDQISKMKPNILGNIETQIRNLQQNQSSFSSTSGRYNSMLSGIPEQQKELLEISRDENIQNSIYQFLLQKREESVLSYTNVNQDSKVINLANSSGRPVSPKTTMIYFAALLLGLVLPVIFVNGREMLNNKILYRKEIESLTSIPVIGEIVHDKSRNSLVLEPGKRSFIAEEFRKIRVSLLFLGIDSYHKKILLTSSIPGEGKSFIAANLAVSLAMTGKKVVLVDADLHNPSLGKLFGVTTEEIGVSDYLLGEKTADEIIRKVDNHQNLSFVSSGGLHPTPSELLENGQIQNLVTYLEGIFDLVVIDTAPIVMVTDAYHLSSLADATLFVVRHKYTPKMLVKRIDENNKINSLKNPAIIFNGVKTRGFMKNNYGYGYDYVYGGNQKISKGKKLKA